MIFSPPPDTAPPTVSVVIPAFNAEKYIEQALNSVQAQTYADWELIVVDDGSQDNTGAIVQRFAQSDNRIKCIKQENKGLGSARNVGIRAARGKFVAFLDSDDLWLVEKLALQVTVARQQQADVVFSAGYIFSENDITNEGNTFHALEGLLVGKSFFDLLFAGNMIPVLSVLVRREVLAKSELFEEGRSYCEDYDLWLRLAHRGAVFYGLPQKLVRYRIHEGALSRNEIEMLHAELTVLHRWRHESTDAVSARRFQGLYRRLILAHMKKGEKRQARQQLRALSRCGRFDPVTLLQRLMLLCLPDFYVAIIEASQWFKLRIRRPSGK